MGSGSSGAGCSGEVEGGAQGSFRAPPNFAVVTCCKLSSMPKPLDPQTKKHLAARVKYYKEMGIHDFYRQPIDPSVELALQPVAESTPEKVPMATQISPSIPRVINDKNSALKLIREDIGECTRCRLHKGPTRSSSARAM